MKNLKLLVLTGFAIAIISGCTDRFEEINSTPNNPTHVKTSGLFNNAVKNIVGLHIRGEDGSARIALPWMQYSAQLNYTNEDRFLLKEIANGYLFFTYYREAKNIKSILDLNTNPATATEMTAYGNRNNQIAAARIILAYIFQNLTDTYGDIPYYSFGNNDPDFQALDIDNPTPKFATQQKIYTDLLQELKAAVAMIELNEPVFYDNQDPYFGNAEKLKRFGNSLRLRIANRVKNVIATANEHIQEAIASGVMQSNNDSVGVTFEANATNPAPTYQSFFLFNRTDYTVSNTFVNLLKGEKGPFKTDPRLQKMVAPVGVSKQNILNKKYSDTDDLTRYQGMPYGLSSSYAPTQAGYASLFGYEVFRPDYTEYLMEYAEVEFLLSEINNWNTENYKKGTAASMEKWGVSQEAITAYLNELPAANPENVLTQKYIALFMQPYEAWAEWRRTGFPKVLIQPGDSQPYIIPVNGNPTYNFIPLQSLKEIPSRLTYPADQQTLNTKSYLEALEKIAGGDRLDTRLIWDPN